MDTLICSVYGICHNSSIIQLIWQHLLAVRRTGVAIHEPGKHNTQMQQTGGAELHLRWDDLMQSLSSFLVNWVSVICLLNFMIYNFEGGRGVEILGQTTGILNLCIFVSYCFSFYPPSLLSSPLSPLPLPLCLVHIQNFEKE